MPDIKPVMGETYKVKSGQASSDWNVQFSSNVADGDNVKFEIGGQVYVGKADVPGSKVVFDSPAPAGLTAGTVTVTVMINNSGKDDFPIIIE